MKKLFLQHDGKMVESDSRFTHVMAVALDPRTNYEEGVIRCITSREGSITVSGYVDRSELRKVRKDSSGKFVIGEKLSIANEFEIVSHLKGDLDFIGLEDPDIWIDEEKDLMHLYFTLPFINTAEHSKNKIHLGHAVGKDLDSLEMTETVLLADSLGGAKELSVAPVNNNGVRLNLVESSKKEADFIYSVIRTAVAGDMSKPWKFGNIVFHPKEHDIPWIGGHASPGPFFSKKFIDVGKGKLLGIINGREANKRIDGKIKYGMFSVGLYIYDYENGKIDWVSPQPLIQDSEAETITFVSQLIEASHDEAIVYAHVDDSFIRAYTLHSETLRSLIPPIFEN